MNTVFLVYKNSDMIEGRGLMVLDCVFSTLDAATQYANSKSGVMGRKPSANGWGEYGDWRVEECVVFDDGSDVTKIKEQKLRDKALAKLSDVEKKVLGLI